MNPLDKRFTDLNIKEQLSLVQATLEGHAIEFKGTRTSVYRKTEKLTPTGGLNDFNSHAIMRVDVKSMKRKSELLARLDELKVQMDEVNNELEKFNAYV